MAASVDISDVADDLLGLDLEDVVANQDDELPAPTNQHQGLVDLMGPAENANINTTNSKDEDDSIIDLF